MPPRESILDALNRVIVQYDESPEPEGARVRGTMRFGAELEGPPKRLHGGHHTYVRTLPILSRLAAHQGQPTYPCAIDVVVQRSLPLDEDVPFDASYTVGEHGWRLETRFQDTERLRATVRQLPDEPLMTAAERERWKALYAQSTPSDGSFKLFGATIHIARDMVYLESDRPRQTAPDSQIVRLLDDGGHYGPAFMATQMDAIGASGRGTVMRHPHFTKRFELNIAQGRIPGDTHVLCLADRTSIVEDTASGTSAVEIKGEMWGTAVVPVALFDSAFEHVYATGRVTVHPVDPSKFAALDEMRKLRQDR